MARRSLILMAMSMLTMFSCGGRGASADAAKATADSLLAASGLRAEVQTDTLGEGWKEIPVTEVSMFPVKAFAKDWMALTAGKSGKANSMTISWGEIGELWARPVMTVFVSGSRYTHTLMDESRTFCVSQLPSAPKFRKALEKIGSESFRDNPSKTEDAGLSFILTPDGTPAIAQAWRIFECRTLYKDDFDLERLPKDISAMYADMKVHTAYYAEIIKVYEREQ